MQTFTSIVFLALLAPIFAVPFEHLEARKNDDDKTSSLRYQTKTLFAVPTSQVPVIRPFESLIPSLFPIAPKPTGHGTPLHTGATEEGERKHTGSGHPFPSGTGFPHYTYHTKSFKLHPTGKPGKNDGHHTY